MMRWGVSSPSKPLQPCLDDESDEIKNDAVAAQAYVEHDWGNFKYASET